MMNSYCDAYDDSALNFKNAFVFALRLSWFHAVIGP